ncbi:MAG: L,D-transpeptidase [Hyphomicrobiales bacterium]|nr:L,D-transpeptidase [Hyphomicrobiales bacterium]MDE2115512.1 L,D-transpeptidase [Hyphomicrobiales bacterium]
MRFFALLMVLIASTLMITVPARAAVDISVDLSSQTMHVQADNGATYEWPVSSARRGYITPRGNYHVQRMETMHYSHEYDMAPMPHSIFFRGGYAIHGGYSAASMGVPRSHGCVRLSSANAATLFALVRQEGARIHITGEPRFPVYTASRRVHKHGHPSLSHKRYMAKLRAHKRYLARLHNRSMARNHRRFAYAHHHHRTGNGHYLAYTGNHAAHSAPAQVKVRNWQLNPLQFFQ